MQITRIAAGVDFSPESDAAVEHAMDLARRAGAEVVLVHVCPIAEPPEHAHQQDNEWQKFMRRQLAANRERLEEMRTSLSGQGVEIAHVVIDAIPADGLLQSANELDADLICLGTHGYTGLDRLLLGSVAERVIRDSRKNTVVVRGEFKPRGGYRRILVPTDFSAAAEGAIAAATTLVAEGGEIEVRHFWHTPTFGPVPDPENLRSLADTSTTQRGAELLEVYQSRDSYNMTFRASHSNPRQGILDLLEQGAYELVVMGSHGRRGIARWLLGSVAEATVRHAPCSVLVIKEPAGKPASGPSA